MQFTDNVELKQDYVTNADQRQRRPLQQQVVITGSWHIKFCWCPNPLLHHLNTSKQSRCPPMSSYCDWKHLHPQQVCAKM